MIFIKTIPIQKFQFQLNIYSKIIRAFLIVKDTRLRKLTLLICYNIDLVNNGRRGSFCFILTTTQEDFAGLRARLRTQKNATWRITSRSSLITWGSSFGRWSSWQCWWGIFKEIRRHWNRDIAFRRWLHTLNLLPKRLPTLEILRIAKRKKISIQVGPFPKESHNCYRVWLVNFGLRTYISR